MSGGIGLGPEILEVINKGSVSSSLGARPPSPNNITGPIEITGGNVRSPFGIKINMASSAISSWPWSKKGKWEPYEPEGSTQVKKNRKAFGYSDGGQNFSGVSLEHFVVAQNRLVEQLLNAEELERVLSHLGIKLTLPKDQAYGFGYMESQTIALLAYQEIYKKLAQEGYSPEVIDLINGSTYADPRLKIDIIGQNENPRRQAVFEAIANGLDALGHNIGQFGKGVKQILDWLSPTGADRIDVWTKEKAGRPYQLTILKDTLGQEYIQIKEISHQDFLKAGALDNEQGTIVRVTIQDRIPLTEQELDERRRNSQQAIIAGIRKRFPFVTSVRITTQIGKNEPQEVNGFGTKEVIIPPKTSQLTPKDSQGKDVRIKINANSITIIDNGKGMDAEILSRMFVPKEGTKHPESLSAEQAREELRKVKVVLDTKLPHRISFARNGEVVMVVDIPEDVIPQATVAGGLMLEFALLLDVPESRDQSRIPSDLKPGEVSNFQLAVEYMVNQIISHPDLTDMEKVKYINTLVVGLDGLIQENVHYAHLIKNIKANLRKHLTETIRRLKQQGFIILPHNKQFAQLALPEGKKALFVNKDLFHWQGAISLKEIGASIIPRVSLGGERHLPLVVIPFTEESLKGAARFYRDWHTWENSNRIPIIKTDSFIALPQQFSGVQRILELAMKQSKGARFSQEEKEEFSSLLQMVNIISAEKVVTSYELTKPPENLIRAFPEFVKIDSDKIDSAAINGFLIQPPPMVSGVESKVLPQQIPTDANQRYVVLENGDLLEAGTGRKVPVADEKVKKIEALDKDYYIIETEKEYVLWKLDKNTTGEPIMSIPKDKGQMIISPKRRFVYIEGKDKEVVDFQIFDLAREKIFSLNWWDLPERGYSDFTFSHLQFSKDEQYLTYLKTDKEDNVELVILSIKSPEDAETSDTWKIGELELKIGLIDGGRIKTDDSRLRPPPFSRSSRVISFGKTQIDYAINPFAKVIFVQDKKTELMTMIDLENGEIVAPQKKIRHLRTDSTGTYTVMIDTNDEISIYIHKAKKVLAAKDFGIKQITAVETSWDDRQPFFVIYGSIEEKFSSKFKFDKDGSIFHSLDLRSTPASEVHSKDGITFSYMYQHVDHKGKWFAVSHFSLRLDQQDPLQRLDKAGAYKHPYFNLFIDNSHPDNPTAIDPKTGNEFSYQGKIVYYHQEEKKILYYNQGQLYNLVEKPIKLLNTYDVIIDNNTPPRFLINLPYLDHWNFLDFSQGVIFTHISINKNDYPSASFDGKYFVLFNPHNGNTAYLDPSKPEAPIFVSIQPAVFTDIKPPDAPNRFVISISKGNPAIFDTETGEVEELFFEEKHLHPGNVPLGGPASSSSIENRIKRVNRNTFISYDKDDNYKIFRRDESGLKLLGEGQRSSGNEIVAYTDKLVIVQEEPTDHYVIDVDTGKFYPPDPADKFLNDSHLSASGRFSVHQKIWLEDNILYYYDHTETDPSAKTIAKKEDYSEYLVHKDADVVILKDKNGYYNLYNLSLNHNQIIGATHIEIDSSGMFAVVKKVTGQAHSLFYVNLETGVHEEGYGVTLKSIRFASDDKYVYVMTEKDENVDSVNISVYKKEFGIKFDSMPYEAFINENSGYGNPRFWEEYTLTKKTIWDREKKDAAVDIKASLHEKEISFLDNPPTNPKWEMRLSGVTAILRDQSKGGLTSIINSETYEKQEYYYSSRDDKFYSLPGGKVWYRIENGTTFYKGRFVYQRYGMHNKRFLLLRGKALVLGGDEKIYLVNSEGEEKEITHLIPSGFIPLEVNGEYFVFSNPTNGEIKYLDPGGISFTKDDTKSHLTPDQEEEQEKALRLWQEHILSKRDDFIVLARASYTPLLDLIPEEYRGEIQEALKPEINKLYPEQEEEIRKRYQSLLEGKPLDLAPTLPFDLFLGRMSKLMAKLSEYIEASKDYLAQEEYSVQKRFYSSLFLKIFALGRNFELSLEDLELDANFFEVLGLGWEINNQEGLESLTLIAEFINSLRQATLNQLKLSEAISLLEFLFSVKPLSVLKKQLQKLLSRKEEVKNEFLKRLYSAFKGIKVAELIAYLNNPQGQYNLGEMRPFLVFLSQEVDELPERKRVIPEGEDVLLPAGGISISQIMNREVQRPKAGPQDRVMDIEDLIRRILNLPRPSANLERELLNNITVQREYGAHPAEIAQNSKDATQGRKGELEVAFYLQNNERIQEFVEEATDNGPGALQEVALLIPMSTKAESGQLDLTGFFGTGKYTIFAGVDRVEIITHNGQRAFMFIFRVIKDEPGKPIGLKLTGIRRINDERVKQGVTVRRIKEVSNTIPELDAMLIQHSWKIFTGLSQGENFRIWFIDAEGKRQPLDVKKEVLSEIDFRANKPGEDQETNFGKLRIISAKDMPLQIVDRAGLRVGEIKEEYLALIPHSLRPHLQELGLVIQIPLPLIRNRSSFEHENEYLPLIQKYVAIAFYQAIVYKTLTQTSPQFVFENLPLDWETNGAYLNAINLKDKNLVRLAQKINQGRYNEISEEELTNLLPAPGVLDKEKRFLKLMLLIEVAIDQNKPETRTSLLLRRLAIQQKISKERAKSQQGLLREAGLTIGNTPDIIEVPLFEEKLLQATGIADAHEQMRNPEKYIVPQEKYLEADQKLVERAFSIAGHFGIEQVILVQGVKFAGAFKEYQGKKTMFLNSSLARQDSDEATDTIIHELAHFLEQLMREDETGRFWEKVFVAHTADFTHDAVGTFAEAMKYATAVSLAKYGLTTSSPFQEEMPNFVAQGTAIKSSSPVSNEEEVSSASESKNQVGESGRLSDELGGVDFQALPIVIEPALSPQSTFRFRSGQAISSPQISLDNINLDEEWTQIQNMLKAGIRPSSERIREYALASSSLKPEEHCRQRDKLLDCIADVLRLEEERVLPMEAVLREMLVLLESDKPANELQSALSRITVLPKAPQRN